jgi:UDP-GlcNAc:undecaprenyl-phosphate GlcNAc-1-phosphate transferase
LFALREIALKLGWVDEPGGRKQHLTAVPAIGGVAMFLAFCASTIFLPQSITHIGVLILASMLMLVVGFYDDRRGLSARLRLLLQLGCATLIAIQGDIVLTTFGPVFSPVTIELGAWAVLISIFCIVGVINAMNMSDGLDGLAGGYALNTFLLLSIAAVQAGRMADAEVLFVMIAIVAAFLLFNYRFPGRRHALLFMGDAGSMFLGLVLAWFLIDLTQGADAAMSPVVALWFFAIPLYDTVSVMVRRIAKGGSPFKADRNHIHHVLHAHGFSTLQTTAILHSLSLTLGSVGLALDLAAVPNYMMFWILAGIFAGYCLVMSRAWRMIETRAEAVTSHN